jgi:hypothetical protein
MVYSKTNLNINGDRIYPCFRPFWIGSASDRFLPMGRKKKESEGIKAQVTKDSNKQKLKNKTTQNCGQRGEREKTHRKF